MKFATYNTLHSINGRNIFRYLAVFISAACFKYSILLKYLAKHAPKTVQLLHECDADVLCLNEVIREKGQFEYIKNQLHKMNYSSIQWSSIYCAAQKLEVGTILASKIPGEEISITILSSGSLCGGRGICALFLPSQNVTVVALHLSIYKREQCEQITKISEFAKSQKKLKRAVVLMGDWNLRQTKIQQYSCFQQLQMASSGLKTHPSIFPFQDIDHIFHSTNMKCKYAKTAHGLSDHLMLIAEITNKSSGP